MVLLASALRCSPTDFENTSVLLFLRYYAASMRLKLLVPKE